MDSTLQQEAAAARADIDFLRRRIADNIQSFKGKRLHSRALAFRLKMAVVCLGVGSTIVLGIKPYIEKSWPAEWLGALALILTALVPIVAAWESFFDYRWMWARYTAVLNTLYGISDDLEFAMSQNTLPDVTTVRTLYDKLQSALQEADKDWTAKRLKDEADDIAQAKATK